MTLPSPETAVGGEHAWVWEVERSSTRWSEADVLCDIQVEIRRVPLHGILKLSKYFGAGIVDLGLTKLQRVFGTMKMGEIPGTVGEEQRGRET